MAEKTRVCWTVIRPVLIERRSQAVTAPSRMNRTSKTGRCVVPPSISGAKTVRPPRTTREPKAGKERRAAGSCSGSIPHITNPKLLSDLQTQARGRDGSVRGRARPLPIHVGRQGQADGNVFQRQLLCEL